MKGRSGGGLIRMNDLRAAVDLFAGGGGLTVGLKKAGFSVKAAVEIDRNASATYVANHPEVTMFEQNIRMIRGDTLLDLCPDKIDLVAGCPPCQGFTSLTSKYKRSDPRNFLVREMSRLIEETKPLTVMMENVPGLNNRGKELMNEFLERLERLGYKLSMEVLQVANYGVPQHRRRLVVLAGLGFEIPMPEPTHSKDGTGGLSTWRTVQDAIGGLREPVTLQEANQNSSPEDYDWHVVSAMSEINRLRLRYAKPGKSRLDIPEEIRPQCHKDGYSGYTNVYGRMAWNELAPTITSGCTTLSKGRFGHPDQERTISVREAALLQTMPLHYKIATPYMLHACQIVGNALPCDFAEILARQCLISIKRHTG